MKLPLPPRATIRTISRWQDTNEVVLALDVDGETQRFTLDDDGLCFLAEELPVQRWLRKLNVVSVRVGLHPRETNDQSEMSSEIPSCDGSPKDGHVQVPSAAADAAAEGE